MRADRTHQALTWRAAAVGALLASLVFGAQARALDEETPEVLRRKYDDAVKELNRTQDALKGEHERLVAATEDNKKLTAKVEELTKQLNTANADLAKLRQDQEEQAEKTFFLRSHYAAWEAFIKQYPELRARWKVYMESDFVSPRKDEPRISDEWPTTTES